MKCVSMGILVALFCATALASASAKRPSMQEVILGIPFDEIEKNIDQYMPNVKCITGVVDTVLTENDSEAKKWWDEMKTTIIRLANIDMKKCMAIADPEEQLKCKKILIRDGVEAGFEVPTKFVGSMNWEITQTIEKAVIWKCFDARAILRILKQLKQLNVLHLLPEIVIEYSEMNGNIAKENGLGDVWAATETKLQPHLQKWSKCDGKMRVLSTICHMREGTISLKLIADYFLSIGEENAPVIVKVIEKVRQTWFAPLEIP